MSRYFWRGLESIRNRMKFTKVYNSSWMLGFPLYGILHNWSAVKCAATDSKKSINKDNSVNNDNIKRACMKGDESLSQLMQTIEGIIVEISKQYRECLVKQISLIEEGIEKGPVGDHWDDLTEFRVKANELKEEFTKYQTLVKSLSQLAYNQAIASLLTGNSNAMDLINVRLSKLETVLEEEIKENKKYETELLLANRDNILYDH